MKNKNIIKYCKKNFRLDSDSPSYLSNKRGMNIGCLVSNRKVSYWRTAINGRTVSIHNIVYALSSGDWSVFKKVKTLKWDMCHLNDRGTDNRPSNLILAPKSWNAQMRKPTKGYKGVSWHKKNKKWQATCTLSGNRKHLVYFLSDKDAAIIYDTFVLDNLCPYAYLNILERTNG